MELFVVNRYLEATGPDRKSSEKALRKLQQLSRKRYLQACAAKDEETVKKDKVEPISTSPVQETVRKNKKKHKRSKSVDDGATERSQNDADADFSHNSPDHESHTNRKHKSEEKHTEPVCDDDGGPSAKKSRKSKVFTEKRSEDQEMELKNVAENGMPSQQGAEESTVENGSAVKHRRRRGRKRRLIVPKSSGPSIGIEKPLENGDAVGGYTVIGQVKDTRRQKVKRVLPDWLAKPTIVSIDLGGQLTPVDDIAGLRDHLVRRLRQNGVTHFFPVQSSVIPWLLKRITRNFIRHSDLCVSSPTGSGKTLAFVLPIIQSLMERVVCSIKALVVLPVRDLALQVFKVFENYTAGTQLKVGLAVGEHSLSKERETLIKDGKSLVDILVCTPGRLVNHISQTPGFSLENLRFLVIDEADRMMQLIKQDWLNEVEKCILKSRSSNESNPLAIHGMADLRQMPQKLLFSATLSQDPEKLHEVKLFQPKLFTSVISGDGHGCLTAQDESVGEFVGKYTTPKELNEVCVQCENFLKPLVLLHFIHNLGYRHLLCFTNTVESSHRLALLLSRYGGGVTVREYSSKLAEPARNKILRKFREGFVDIVVCSDAMTRGMDVEDVDYVISYDLPPYLKTYIHRVGRTARAGRVGTAISLVERKEMSFFSKMMASRNVTIEQKAVDTALLEPMEEQYKCALEHVKNHIMEERLKA